MPPDLWTFTLGFYGRPGVSPAFLRCQDEAGADVNLLLFGLWQAQAGVVLTTEEITALIEAVRDWRQQVIHPLRAVRRHLKGAGAEPLREMVKAAEIEAERCQLQTLAASARSAGGAVALDAARRNFDAYQTACGTSFPAAALDVLLEAFAE